MQLLCVLLLSACASVPDNPRAELVMVPGETIEASTPQGTMRISYVDRYTRRYIWNGWDKTFRHQTRQERWNGSLGMYRPQGDGTMHAVLEEGQQHFDSIGEARRWLGKQEEWMDYVWDREGLAVGWKQQGRPDDGFIALQVNVWQILVHGKKAQLPGATPSRIEVTKAPY